MSAGTTNIDEPWYGWISGLVTAMTTRMSATEPLVVYHLWPLMIHSPPSLTARVLSNRGSLPAVSGSVIEKPERIVPSSSGWSQRSRMYSWFAGHLHAGGEQFGVAAVGRVVAEDDRAVGRLAEDLVHQSEAHLSEAHAAEIRGQVRGPESALANLVLQAA